LLERRMILGGREAAQGVIDAVSAPTSGRRHWRR
jgi:hypothetical protein